MPIDLEAIRNKVNQLSGNLKSKSNLQFWNPDVGDYVIRVLPWKANIDNQPFKERWFYYGIGKRGILAPTQFQKPDPIQELINKLHNSGKKEDKEFAKRLYPKMRAYAPVIIRGAEDKGVHVWSFNKAIYSRLLNFFLEGDDILDQTEGFDLKVKVARSGKMFNGKANLEMTVDLARKASPVLADEAKAVAILDSVPNLDEYYKQQSYDEIKATLTEWITAGSPDKDASSTTEAAVTAESDELDQLAKDISAKTEVSSEKKEAAKAKPVKKDADETPPASKESKKKIDAAFDELDSLLD